MKIGRNDKCPCGSGQKYKKCCLKKSRNIDVNRSVSYDIDILKEENEFFINRRGAVVFKDESKQPTLVLPEGDTIKDVLSVGLLKSGKPIANIQENDGVICYVLPSWYLNWCQMCVELSMSGTNLFPLKVMFSKTNGHYSVDIL